MFKDLLLNVDNIESVISDYFSERYFDYKVTLNEEKSKLNNNVYDVNFDGRNLFLSVFINKKGKVTLKVKEGKEQEEKALLATYIKESSKCKLSGDTKNKSITFKNIDIDSFNDVIEIIKDEEWCTSCKLVEDNKIKVSYKAEGIHRDILTMNYFKTTHKVMLQGLPLEVFNYTISYFNELLDIDEVVNTMNETCNETIDVTIIDKKLKSIMPNSYEKHTDKLKKSLIKSIYNLEVTCEKLTCTELIFEPLRAMEGHVIITLSKDYGIIKPCINNLSMFTYDKENDIVNFRKNTDENKVRKKNNKVDYYKKAYKHIVKYRHVYFHWNWNEELEQDMTLHLEDVRVAKEIILDTLKLIDEYYI